MEDPDKKNPDITPPAAGEDQESPVIYKGEWKLAQGVSLLFISNVQRGEELIDQAIACIREALLLGLSPKQTDVAYSQLGLSYHNRYKYKHEREDLDLALQYYSRCLESVQFESNWENCIDIGGAFYARYQVDANSKDLNQAIYFLTKAADLLKKYKIDRVVDYCIPLNHCLGKAYYDLFTLGHDSADLERSISCHKFVCAFYEQTHLKDENLEKDRAAAFYDYAISLLKRWEKSSNQYDLKETLKYLLKSLEVDEYYFNTYYALRDVFYAQRKLIEGDQCINMALYLRLTHKARWQPDYRNIIDRIHPDHLYDSLRYLQRVSPQNVLRARDAEQFFPQTDYLILLQYLGPDAVPPVLLFYLGGQVSSYIIFDEVLDTNSNRVMTPQEQYYYVRSALSLFDYKQTLVGADSILDYAISAVQGQNPTSDEDLFYLGQLHYLKALRTSDKGKLSQCLKSAEECFLRSEDFIWSRAMLDVIGNNDSNKVHVFGYISSHCQSPRFIPKGSIGAPSFLDQFSDYFHFNEVYFACPQYFSGIIGLGPDLEFYKPLWEVFRLTKADYELLTLQLREILGKSIEQDIAFCVANAVEPISNEEIHRIENDFVGYEGLNNSDDVEQTAQRFIRDSKMVWEDKAVLLRWLFNEGKITSDQYFTLLKYNEHCKSVESGQKNNLAMSIVPSICSSVAGQMLLNNPYGSVLSGFITGLLAFLLNKIEIKPDNYYSFKNGLWKVINNEYLPDDQYIYIA